METKTIKELKKGELFKTTENGPVWIRNYYCKEDKTYECYKYEDCMHEHFFKGTKKVYINFEY